MTQHAGARGMRFVVFTRELLCVNKPHASFYTRTVHDGFKTTALENGIKRMVRDGRAGIPNLNGL